MSELTRHKQIEDIGRRCPRGCATWPDEDEFATCPKCHRRTRRYRGAHPLSSDEAVSLVKHIEFDRYYDERASHMPVI